MSRFSHPGKKSMFVKKYKKSNGVVVHCLMVRPRESKNEAICKENRDIKVL